MDTDETSVMEEYADEFCLSYQCLSVFIRG